MMMPEMRQGIYRNSDHDECVSAFDAAGPGFVPAAGDTTAWIYDEATGLLTSKLYPDGNGPAYTYTIDGKPASRTWARGVVTEYTYDAWGNVRRVDYSDTTPSIVIDYDSMGRETNITDAAGTTAVLYDSCGAVANETVTGALGTKSISRFYDTFGRTTVHSSGALSLANPYRFSSEYADDTLGLVYYNYRHYNPLDGRWTSRDPIEEDGGLNIYKHISSGADILGLKIVWAVRDLADWFVSMGNHHFIAFIYENKSDAPHQLVGALEPITCESSGCKIIFIQLVF